MIVINRKGANHRTNVIQIYFLKGNRFKRSRIYIIGIKIFQRLQIAVGRSLVVRSGVLLIQERDASQLKRLNGRSVITSKRLQLRFRRHWTDAHICWNSQQFNNKSKVAEYHFDRMGSVRHRLAEVRHECNVVLVGDVRVGKSALVNRFINNKFSEVSLDRVS